MGTGQLQQHEVARHLRAQLAPEWTALTERVIGLAMEVHSLLGPGLAERLYEDALCHELNKAGLRVQRQYPFSMKYNEIMLGEQKPDLVVNDVLVLELKSVDGVSDIHLAQLLNCLRSARFPLGLLINFNVLRLKDGIHRRINPSARPQAPASLNLSPPSASL